MSTFKPYQIIGPRDLTSYTIGQIAHIRILQRHHIERNIHSGEITGRPQMPVFPDIEQVAAHRLNCTLGNSQATKFINDRPVTPPNPRHHKGSYRCTHDDLLIGNLLAQRIGQEVLDPDITAIAWRLYGPNTTAAKYNMLLGLSASARAKLMADPTLITCARLANHRETCKDATRSKGSRGNRNMPRNRHLTVQQLEEIASGTVQALSADLSEEVLRSYASIPPNVAAIIENTIHDRIATTSLKKGNPDTNGEQFTGLIGQIAQHLHTHPGALENMAPWMVNEHVKGILNGEKPDEIIASLCRRLVEDIMNQHRCRPTYLDSDHDGTTRALRTRTNDVLNSVVALISARPEILKGSELVAIAERLTSLFLLLDWQANQQQRIPNIQPHPIMHWTASEIAAAATSEEITAHAFGLETTEMITNWTTINLWLARTSRQYRHTQHLGPDQHMNLHRECRQLVDLIEARSASSIDKLLCQDQHRANKTGATGPGKWSREDRNLFTTNLLRLAIMQPEKDDIARHYAALASADPSITETETWTATVRKMMEHTRIKKPTVTNTAENAERIYRHLPPMASTHIVVLHLRNGTDPLAPHPRPERALKTVKTMAHNIKATARAMAKTGCHPLISPEIKTAIWSLADTAKLPWKIIQQPASINGNDQEWTFFRNSEPVSIGVVHHPENRRKNPAWHDETAAEQTAQGHLDMQKQIDHLIQEMGWIERQMELEPTTLDDLNQDIMVYAAIHHLLKTSNPYSGSSITRNHAEHIAEAAVADIRGPRRVMRTSILISTGNNHYHLIENGAAAVMERQYDSHRRALNSMTPAALMSIIQK